MARAARNNRLSRSGDDSSEAPMTPGGEGSLQVTRIESGRFYILEADLMLPVIVTDTWIQVTLTQLDVEAGTLVIAGAENKLSQKLSDAGDAHPT